MDLMLSEREMKTAVAERDLGRHERLWHYNRKVYYAVMERTDLRWQPGSSENIRRKQNYVNLLLALVGEL